MSRTCEHGMPGCLMPERHEATECCNQEMVDMGKEESVAAFAATEVQILMSEPDVALEVLRQLDEQLHPWGEVGEVPAEDGEYYVVHGTEVDAHPACIKTALGEPLLRMVTLYGWNEWGENLTTDDDLVREHRFRKRWMPAPPSGGQP